MTAPRRPGIVCLWATPRSVSTAFEKALSRNRAAAVVHEPFTDCYYFGPDRRSGRYGQQPAKARFVAADAWRLVEEPADEFVCVKDLAFQAEPYLTDADLAGVGNTFIVRHPKAVLRSLLRLKPDFTDDEFGFTALARLYDRVRLATGEVPLVVDGDAFRADPAGVLADYCRHTGLPFDEQMLTWPDGRIREWQPDEQLSQAKWHATLEASHGVLPPGPPADGFEVPPDRADCYRQALAIYTELRRQPQLLGPH